MKIISDLFGSFLGQGLLGFFVIGIIFVLGVFGILFSLRLKKIYKDLREELNSSEFIGGDSRERDLTSTVLYDIAEEFKLSAEKGTENINTEVLILKHLRKHMNINEKRLKLLPSSSIALGLLGTFLGLTVAIHSTNGVLESGIKTMEVFLAKMDVPLQGMASAFWTSIFGVIVSVILNLLIEEMKKEKEAFYDEFENYLDNTLYSEYSYSFVTQFERFNNTISSSMITLTKEMRALFKEGVDELVSNINKNTVDMTESSKVLARYTKELELVIFSLNKSVDNFKEPINMFKASIDDFEITTEKLEFVMNTSVSKLSDKLDILCDTLNKLDMSIEGEREYISLINDELKGYKENLDNSYRELIKSTESINKSIEDGNERAILQVDSLRRGYDGFEEGINEFVSNVELLREGIGECISKILRDELLNISEEMAKKLNTALSGIEDATESLSYNTRTVGELVKATNEWVAATS